MSDDTRTTIYNATDGPLAIDRAGRMLAARSSTDVKSLDGLSSDLEAERIVVVEQTDEQPAEDSAAGELPQPEQQTTTRTRKGRASTQES
jgi:hypothetical protein